MRRQTVLLPVLLLMLVLSMASARPVQAGGCARAASYYVQHEGWGAFDYVVRFVIPHGASYQIVANGWRASNTLSVSRSTGGVTHYDTNIGRVVYVTAGWRARSAGGYFTTGGIHDFANSIGIWW